MSGPAPAAGRPRAAGRRRGTGRRRGAAPRLAAVLLAATLAAIPLAGCGLADSGATPEELARRKVRVTTTTNFITDLARVVGGDRVEVTGLMGPGVDPHLYKASAGDVDALRDADAIFYGGLELEGRMADLLIEVGEERPTRAVTDGIPREQLLASTTYKGRHDPHVWFDVTLWKRATRTVADEYKRLDPINAAGYRQRARRYLAELDDLDAFVRRRAAEVPERSRVLVTSHDAFSYFGRRYGFEVVAIQGISTQTEATTADIERVADVIARRRLKAVFVESSVPRQTIDAVLAAAAKRGQRARIGGLLFSDAAGDPGTPEGTYLGMVRHNIDLIVEGLR